MMEKNHLPNATSMTLPLYRKADDGKSLCPTQCRANFISKGYALRFLRIPSVGLRRLYKA